MIRITNPIHQRRFTAGSEEIVLDCCAVKLMQLSVIGSDVYAHGARVMVVWGRKNLPAQAGAAGEFIAAEPLVFEEFSLANVREERRTEYFQKAVGESAAADPTIEQHAVVVRPADNALEQLMTPQLGQVNRRFGDVRMRDFENWLISSGKIEGVIE